ncbi:MAG: DUF5009 domain-containing protein [Planctomycetes bacterium]|nr:DUF5009 domain-containing protein [Planctomycetota bacterium]
MAESTLLERPTQPPAKPASSPAANPPVTAAGQERLLSLDAYRGLIMTALMFNGFGLAAAAKNHVALNQAAHEPIAFWSAVQYQFSHVEWRGCAFWDLIQPSFMFMVGVSMAYSYLKRQQQGASWIGMFAHACWRAVILVALGVFLTSGSASATEWQFMNVLSQIGLGYPFLYLMWRRPTWLQGVVAAVLLVGAWIAYATYPTQGINFETGNPKAGVTAQWAQAHLESLPPVWHKNANVGQAVDLKVLNELPRGKPFEFNAGGYQTINFITSLATMIFGLMCGELLRTSRSPSQKTIMLVAAGLGGLGLGLICSQLGCPLVKRIWTPSWALFSTGWCCLMLAGFYMVIDVLKWRWWTFPLIVVGMNSIASYLLGQLLKPWMLKTLQTHLGSESAGKLLFGWTGKFDAAAVKHGIFGLVPAADLPILQNVLVGLVFWLVLLWMYRRKIFLRI